MNKGKIQKFVEDLELNAKSLTKLRKSELVDVINTLMKVLDEREDEGGGGLEEARASAEVENLRREMLHWKKKYEALEAKASGKIGHGGFRNDRVK